MMVHVTEKAKDILVPFEIAKHRLQAGEQFYLYPGALRY